jgi:class 3 adenylate cyclase
MRKIAAVLVADIVGYSRLAGTDEDRTQSRLRGLRSDLIDPARRASRAHRQANWGWHVWTAPRGQGFG